jgi:hypothetical protein
MRTKNKHSPAASPSLSEIARRTGIRRETLRRWRDVEMIDLTDEKALASRIGMKQPRIGTAPPSPEITGRESYAEARRRREIAVANRAEVIAAKERGELVEIHSIAADGERIGYAVRDTLDRLAHELPPVLAGRAAGEIHKAIKRAFRDALTNLGNYQSAVTFQP